MQKGKKKEENENWLIFFTKRDSGPSFFLLLQISRTFSRLLLLVRASEQQHEMLLSAFAQRNATLSPPRTGAATVCGFRRMQLSLPMSSALRRLVARPQLRSSPSSSSSAVVATAYYNGNNSNSRDPRRQHNNNNNTNHNNN